MKKSLVLFFLLSNFLFGEGVVCPSCPNFQNLSKVEQDEIIKKDFKVLHKLFTDLNLLVENIEQTRNEITKLKKTVNTRNDTCFALSLIQSDLNILSKDISSIHDKNTEEYQDLNKRYVDEKYIYNIEKSKVSCEGMTDE